MGTVQLLKLIFRFCGAKGINNVGIHCAKSSELTVMLAVKPRSRTSWYSPLTSCVPSLSLSIAASPFFPLEKMTSKNKTAEIHMDTVWFRNTSPTPVKSSQEQLDLSRAGLSKHCGCHTSLQQAATLLLCQKSKTGCQESREVSFSLSNLPSLDKIEANTYMYTCYIPGFVSTSGSTLS